jgi:hypothetical protein
MAATSNMLPLGTVLPRFSLINAVDGQRMSTDAFAGKPVSNHQTPSVGCGIK